MTGQKIGFPQGTLCDPILSQAYLQHRDLCPKDALNEISQWFQEQAPTPHDTDLRADILSVLLCKVN